MITELSNEQVSSYQNDGFIHIPGFLSNGEVETWRTKVEAAVAGRDERIPGSGDGGIIGKEEYDSVFLQRVNLWQTDLEISALVLDERIGRLAATLERLDCVRLWHDQALIKKPWANSTTWHIDDPYWSFYTRQATTCWIALDDVTIQNGALYFLPGTHKQSTFDNVNIGARMDALFDVYPDWAHIEPVPVEMKAGDCSFHNGLTAHAAGPNMTVSDRRAFAIIYMPDGATFNGNRNVLPEALSQSLSKGDILDDASQNPVIFRK